MNAQQPEHDMKCAAIEDQARTMAEKAKPGIVKVGEKTYTLVFDSREWVYRVYEDGFLLVSFNTKTLASATRWLFEYLLA
jgi:hypothetical protein